MRKICCLECGGELVIDESGLKGKCKYCGAEWILNEPLSDESFVKLQLAIEYQRTFRYADAKRVFLEVAEANESFSEAWWGAFLSEYGIEFGYNRFGELVPTCHRTHPESVYGNQYYRKAVQAAARETKEHYADLADKIENVRTEILRKVASGETYDVFICFKATDGENSKTYSYDFGMNLYRHLTEQGYKVFFSEETLLNVKEQEYEPYIYKALSTARVMLLLCADEKEIESAWVKNEWARFLDMRQGGGLVPVCGNAHQRFAPTRLPAELQKFNAIAFNESVLEKIDKKVASYFEDRIKAKEEAKRREKEEKQRREEERRKKEIEEIREMAFAQANKTQAQNQATGATVQSLLDRANTFLENGEKGRAKEYFEKILDMNARCAEAYFGELLLDLGLKSAAGLSAYPNDFTNNKNYQSALKYAGAELAKVYQSYAEKNLEYRKETQYQKAVALMEKGDYEHAIKEFSSPLLKEYKDSQVKINKSKEGKTEQECGALYHKAVKAMKDSDYNLALNFFSNKKLTGYKDVQEKIEECQEKAKAREYAIGVRYMELGEYYKAINYFNQSILTGYKDVGEKLKECKKQEAEKAEKLKQEELQRERERIKAENKKRLKKKLLIAVSCLLAAVILFVGAFFLLQPKFKYEESDGGIVLYVYKDPLNMNKTELIIPSEIDGKTVVGIKGRGTVGINYESQSFLGKEDRFETVVLPETLTSIWERAFVGCKSLVSLDIPDSVTLIGSYAFADCDMESLNTNCVTYIGERAFGSSGFKEIALPNVTAIGESAFSYTTDLTSLTIGNSLKRIDAFAFENSNLKSITFTGTTSEWYSIDRNTYWKSGSALKKVVCSDGEVTF